MKTLYVSDLDGTLLCSDGRTSGCTNEVINRLTAKGMLFTYATARSVYTASKVTAGLTAQIPLITHNGALILDSHTRELLASCFFPPEDAKELLGDLLRHGIFPIVYAYDGRERFSFLDRELSPQTAAFVADRREDPRARRVSCPEQLLEGQVFYFTCIDDPEKMRPLYEKYLERFRCFFQPELYSGDTFFELVPKTVSKGSAALQLKKLVGADRLVAFGDGDNDIGLFEIADEAYAVSNASEQLKAAATGVIGSNDGDSVAKWLETYGEF